jgi:hypothetical protein
MEMGSPQMGFFSSPSPFPYRDYHMETGNPNEIFFSYGDFFLNPQIKMVMDTIWKWVRDWRVTIRKWGAVNPRFNMVIRIWKRGAKNNQSPYRNGHYPFSFGDVSILISWASLLITTM